MTANANQSTLSISGVTMNDTGEYVCVAINSLGEANTRTFLRVRSTQDAVTSANLCNFYFFLLLLHLFYYYYYYFFFIIYILLLLLLLLFLHYCYYFCMVLIILSDHSIIEYL